MISIGLVHSLRPFYAVQSLRRGNGVFGVARNMGTSVEMLQTSYAMGLGD
jgi:hypothetical protein